MIGAVIVFAVLVALISATVIVVIFRSTSRVADEAARHLQDIGRLPSG